MKEVVGRGPHGVDIESAVLEGQVFGVRQHPVDVPEGALGGLASSLLEHLARDVETDHLARVRGQRECAVAGSRGDVEAHVGRPGLGQRDQLFHPGRVGMELGNGVVGGDRREA